MDRRTARIVDLQKANAVVELAIEQGAGLAFAGDTHQAVPVGHAGAIDSAIQHANAAVELDTVHRSRDPDYAALTLRLRDAGDRERALVVAGELAEHGHVARVDHHDAPRERMIEAYFEWHARCKRVTLVSGTNAEADAINDVIQQRRADRGEPDVAVIHRHVSRLDDDERAPREIDSEHVKARRELAVARRPHR